MDLNLNLNLNVSRCEQVCRKLQSDTKRTVWDAEQKVPYLQDGDQWFGYDDEKSLQIKVGKSVDERRSNHN